MSKFLGCRLPLQRIISASGIPLAIRNGFSGTMVGMDATAYKFWDVVQW